MDDDDLCDDLDDLLADDVPDVATDPEFFWPPRPGLIWPGTFPVAQIRRFPTVSHGRAF